jgi:hypothetical protein
MAAMGNEFLMHVIAVWEFFREDAAYTLPLFVPRWRRMLTDHIMNVTGEA